MTMSNQQVCPDPVLDRALTSPEIMIDPYPIYQKLRDEAPVFWSQQWNAWVISRYDDVVESLRDNVNLSNENRQALLFTGLTDNERHELGPLRHYFAQKDVIGSDPPDHTRMRGLVQKAFTPKIVSALEPTIRSLTADLFERALQSGSQFDFIEQIAHPLPVTLIATMLGAPVQDRALFKRWSADILAFQGTGTTTFDAATLSQTSLIAMFEYMNQLIDLRRAQPQDDLITALALAEEGGKQFTRPELLATCNTLLTAGHETTTNLIGNLVRLLLSHPLQWEQLRKDHSMIPAAIEEALRFEAPKQRNFRRVRQPHQVGGMSLAENEMVFQLIGSANRDPRQFPNADTFDIGRGKTNDHLSFGSGIHFCLGAFLARTEAKVVLETILYQMPDVRLLSRPARWQERVQFRGPAELWVDTGK